ncbi:uncharacterized protein LOC114358472, partial [Ostrinia furnacalis]|uniref:uncharacterized protein LOC114358472 n=1 Tax=Ostrinia furnacalis TaxID=93504 RepID=UPI00103D32D6
LKLVLVLNLARIDALLERRATRFSNLYSKLKLVLVLNLARIDALLERRATSADPRAHRRAAGAQGHEVSALAPRAANLAEQPRRSCQLQDLPISWSLDSLAVWFLQFRGCGPNLYSKLKLVLVRKDEQKSAALRAHLARIDALLERRATRFLTGDTMCCFDCELMPRLQHIRVAGKYFVDFEIPTSFRALWRYMYHMYQLDAFTQSCPADQDIINHYKLQQLSVKGLGLSPAPARPSDTNTALKMKKHEELETPTFTTSIPVDVSENHAD